MIIKKISIGLIITFLLGIGVLIQNKLGLTGDVGYLFQASQKLMVGGHYVSDFFETNPPMILYLYLPAVFIATFGIKPTSAMQLYVFILASLSLFLNLYLLTKITYDKEKTTWYVLTLVLALIFFILPISAFAQREYLLILLTLSYFFSAVIRLEGKSLSYVLGAIIGCSAGLGFALKPFFLIPFFFIEAYLLLNIKKISAVCRIESVLIVGILFFYMIAIVIAEPNYIHIILPLVQKYYFPYAKQDWLTFFGPPYVLFCLGGLMMQGLTLRDNYYPQLNNVLALGLIGFILAFLIVRTSWYYHVFPALVFAYLLITMKLTQLFLKIKRKSWLIIFSILLIFCVPLYNALAQFRYKIQNIKNFPIKSVGNFINSQPGDHVIFCMPLATQDCFPLLYLVEGKYGSRFPSFWWYEGVYNTYYHKGYSKALALDKKFLVENVAYDLYYFKPHWVLVNTSLSQTPNLLPFLTNNAIFAKEWKHYQRVKYYPPYALFERQAF